MLEGSFRKPSVHLKAGPILAQAGIAAALAVAAAPLAIVPFLASGGAQDADCDRLLVDAKSHGAVKKTS